MMSINAALAILKGEDRQQQILCMRAQIAAACPTALKALKLIDYDCYTPKRRKGFNLVKRENKRLGFVYYVRYSHNGKTLPSKWNTHTNVLSQAEAFAVQNKDRIISAYMSTHDNEAFRVLENFYKKGSEYLLADIKRNKPLCESHRAAYERIIENKFIPFLRERNIRSICKIDSLVLHNYQDRLLSKGIKSQTVNGYYMPLVRIFRYLTMKGLITENPCLKVNCIPVQAEERKARGCHELEKLKGVFKETWPDEKLYLLCLLGYTTGMRNAEIKKIRLRDIIKMDNHRFIDIRTNKTNNGVRLVPLHDFVYKKIKAFSKGKDDEFLFKTCGTRTFARANLALGTELGINARELLEENITFYSGRHFWKTLMNSEGLGDDIEEFFMGHRVTGNVSKLYNHKDKQGQSRMVEKARRVFAILDRCIFSFTAGKTKNSDTGVPPGNRRQTVVTKRR